MTGTPQGNAFYWQNRGISTVNGNVGIPSLYDQYTDDDWSQDSGQTGSLIGDTGGQGQNKFWNSARTGAAAQGIANIAQIAATNNDDKIKLAQNISKEAGYTGLTMWNPIIGLAARAVDAIGGAAKGMIQGDYDGYEGTKGFDTVMGGMPVFSGLNDIRVGTLNRMFGSKLNHDFIDNEQAKINSNDQKFNQWSTTGLSDINSLRGVRKGQVGTDAHSTIFTKAFNWSGNAFANKAQKTTDKFNRQITASNNANILNKNNQINQINYNNSFLDNMNKMAEGGWVKGKQIAIPFIQQNEGWRSMPYADGKNLRSVGYGFNDSGFRDKYKDGISKHYEKGMTKAQADKEMNWYLDRAIKTLSNIYDKFDLTDNEKAAIIDTYYQKPSAVMKGSKFYSLLEKGDPRAFDYLGVSGYSERNKRRKGLALRNDVDSKEAEAESTREMIVPQIAQSNYYIDQPEYFNSQVDPNEFSAENIYPRPTNNRIPVYDGTGQNLPTQVNVNTTPTVEEIESLYNQYIDGSGREQGIQYSKGGKLVNSSNVDNNKLTYINEGSSHENNPNRGVQIGTDDQGNPNLVEEGEVVANNNYVFSNRLKISDEFAKKYGLKKNSTFAEAIKSLDDSYQERENDRIEKAGLDDNIDILTKEQEALKEREQQQRFNALQQAYNGYMSNYDQQLAMQQMNPQIMMQQNPQGLEQLMAMQQGQQFGIGGYL